MEHSDVIENEIIEGYLLHRLNENETDDFEEHLLYCNECRNQLTRTKTNLGLIQYMALHTVSRESTKIIAPQKASLFGYWVKVAAALFFIFGSATLLWFLVRKPEMPLTQYNSKSDQIKKVKDSIVPNDVSNNTLKKELAINSNEKFFRKLPSFETQIDQEYRSEAIEIISPKNNMEALTSAEKIDFQWQKPGVENLVLMLYNNNGKLIFQKKISSIFHFKQRLQPGLYYWQLETEDDIVYTGKFSVLQPASNTK